MQQLAADLVHFFHLVWMIALSASVLLVIWLKLKPIINGWLQTAREVAWILIVSTAIGNILLWDKQRYCPLTYLEKTIRAGYDSTVEYRQPCILVWLEALMGCKISPAWFSLGVCLALLALCVFAWRKRWFQSRSP